MQFIDAQCNSYNIIVLIHRMCLTEIPPLLRYLFLDDVLVGGRGQGDGFSHDLIQREVVAMAVHHL